MTCADSRKLIGAYADGELDLVKHVEMEEHIRTCPACAALARASVDRRSAITSSASRFAAPASLQGSVRAALRVEAPAPPRATRLRAPSFWAYAGMAASVVIALKVGFAYGSARTRSSNVAAEAVAGHLRSLQAGHLMDVVSTDQHTVKPWFAGKLDFSPPVADLADIGYPLAGGRLERIAGHSAAALVYKRKLHVINVYIWDASSGSPSPAEARTDGFGIVGWSAGSLNFAAVSEIPQDDLRAFAAELAKRTAPASTP